MAEPVLLVEQPEGIASVEVPAHADARRVRRGRRTIWCRFTRSASWSARTLWKAICAAFVQLLLLDRATVCPPYSEPRLHQMEHHHLLLDHIVEQRGACCQRDARSECVFNFADGSQRDACVACVSDVLRPSVLTRVVLPARALRLCAGTARSERHRGSPRRGCRGRNRENVCPTQTARAGSRDTGRRPNRSTRRA